MNYQNAGVGPSSSPETKQHTAALRKAHQKFKTIVKGADNPAFRSKYATFEGCSQALLPHLTEEGFAMPTYHTGYFGPEMGWCCLGVLKHAESGEWTSTLVPLINPPQERRDFKTGETKIVPPNMQGFGGALTFAKRQCLLALTGAWVGEQDDDANAVSHHDERQQAVEATRASAQRLAYEAEAKKAIVTAKDEATAKKHLDTVRLRVREKACTPDVFKRCEEEFNKKWKGELVTNG